jgi:Zn-dependent protease with chaperone function
MHAAQWFDGQSGAVADASVWLRDRTLHARVGDREFAYPAAEVRRSEALAGVPMRLTLPDGGVFVLADTGVNLEIHGSTASQQLVHRLECSPVAVVLALIAVAVFVVSAYQLGIPWLAEKVARRVPIDAENALGVATLAALNGVVFAPSTLPEDRRSDLQARFARLAELAQLPTDPEATFRDGSRIIGANAIALPGGRVVVTDQLVAALESPSEVSAVFAHELGHIAHRHTMRRLLEESSSGLILGALIGDVSGIGSLAAAAPALLLTLKFSREVEEEADDYALALLPRAGIPSVALAGALKSILSQKCADKGTGRAETAKKCTGAERMAMARYLSTHPATEARIERVYASRP